MISLCTAADSDCGCGGNSMTDPFGWDSQESAVSVDTGGSNRGAHDGSSESGSNSAAGTSESGSETSTGSNSGGSGSVSGSESSSDSTLSLISQGLALYRQGDLNQSLSTMNKSLSIDPYSVRAWTIKGDVLSAMGRYEEAVRAYSQVLHLDPSDGSAAAKKGDALMNAGKYQDAIVSYDRAITMNPGLTGIQVNRSVANELASGIIRANISVAKPAEQIESNSSRDLPLGTLPVTTLPATIPPGTPVPGTTKAAGSLPVLLGAFVIAGILSLIFQRR